VIRKFVRAVTNRPQQIAPVGSLSLGLPLSYYLPGGCSFKASVTCCATVSGQVQLPHSGKGLQTFQPSGLRCRALHVTGADMMIDPFFPGRDVETLQGVDGRERDLALQRTTSANPDLPLEISNASSRLCLRLRSREVTRNGNFEKDYCTSA
jgi:hypothetical protein